MAVRGGCPDGPLQLEKEGKGEKEEVKRDPAWTKMSRRDFQGPHEYRALTERTMAHKVFWDAFCKVPESSLAL